MCTVGAVSVGAAAAVLKAQVHPQPTPLAPHEAELLLYLLPDVRELRSRGQEIGWHLDASPRPPADECYHYWVLNSSVGEWASPNVGYYAVHRWTAEIWRAVPWDKVVDTELQGAQEILRKGHGIGGSVFKKYGSCHEK